MIFTVTLNPALDYVIEVDHFEPGKINRNKNENLFFGGKGINVSCILHELGIESTALGFIAGFTGRSLQDGLKAQGIHTDFTEVTEGMTRINVKLRSKEETEINGMGPKITEKDFDALKEKVRRLNRGDTLILSGSIPSCMQSDTYEKIIECLEQDVNLAVDAEKDLLLNVLKYRPFLIKPNSLELGAMFERQLNSEEEILSCARALQERGARNVLVSMGKDGALLLDETGNVSRMPAAEGSCVSSVGAGDSMLGGFLAGYLRTNDYGYALKLGTACGGATAFHAGLASREQIKAVLKTL